MINSVDSKCLSLLKLFLCFSVIFLHMHSQMPSMSLMSDSGSFFFECLRVTRNLVSNLIAKVAVPGFALISGYLFFSTAEFNFSTYKSKVYKRLFSLVIPYFSWVLVVFTGDVLLAYFGKNNLVSTTEWNFANVLNIFWGIKSNDAGFCPYNGPMWYIRDVFLCAVLSPLMYFCLKTRFLRYVILLLFAFLWLFPAFLSPNETIILLYFSLGSFFSISKCDMFKMLKKISKNIVWKVLLGGVLVLAVTNELYVTDLPRNLIVKAFVVLFLPLLFSCVNFFVSERSLKLSKCTFCVYCMHNIILATLGGVTKGMGSGINLLYYFFLPVFTFFVGYGLYMI